MGQYTERLSAVVLPQPPAPPRPWRELWLITIGHGLTHWYPATFYLLLPLIGAAVGPLLGGVVADRFGLLAAFYFLAATIVVANLFILGVRTSRS